MFREKSLTGLGKEARNMVLTFTWLFCYAIIVTSSSWEGNYQAFSPASSTSSVRIYNLPLFPLEVNVISFLLHLLLICTIRKVLSVHSDGGSYCRHIAADHTASAASLPCHCACCQQLLPKASFSSALWLACACFSCRIWFAKLFKFIFWLWEI